MDIRAVAIAVNVDVAVRAIRGAANNGRSMVDFSVHPPLMSLDCPHVTLLDEMHQTIQLEFPFKLQFDCKIVRWES